jgi:hypothetical protein
MIKGRPQVRTANIRRHVSERLDVCLKNHPYEAMGGGVVCSSDDRLQPSVSLLGAPTRRCHNLFHRAAEVPSLSRWTEGIPISSRRLSTSDARPEDARSWPERIRCEE